MNLNDILILEVQQSIEQMRIDRKLQDQMKNKLAQQQKNTGVDAFEAEIYTKVGGVAIKVYSFQRNASNAIKEISALPAFKAFSKRPTRVKLNF